MTDTTLTQPMPDTLPAKHGHHRTNDTRFWDKIARKYAADPIDDVEGYERTLARTADLLEPDYRVLEVGCGTGSTALRLGSAVASYTGADISPEMISIAKEKLENTPARTVRFEVDDADATHFANASFDAVLAFNLLHLVPDLDAALAGIWASLKPGGVFISKTPCLKHMNPLITRVMIPVMQLFGKAPTTVQSFGKTHFEQSIKRAGFAIETVEFHGTKGKDTRPFVVARKT